MHEVARVSGSAIVYAAFATQPVTFFRNVIRKNCHCLQVDEFLAKHLVTKFVIERETK
jgi:hypothetical protein